MLRLPRISIRILRRYASTSTLEENIVKYAKSRNEKRMLKYLNKFDGMPQIETLFAVADMWKLLGNPAMFHESIRSIGEHPHKEKFNSKVVKYYGDLCRVLRNGINSQVNRERIARAISEVVELASTEVHSNKVWSEICRSVDHAVALYDHVRGREKVVHTILCNLLKSNEPITGSHLGNRALSTVQRYHSRHNTNLYDAFERLKFAEKLRRENRVVSRAELLNVIDSNIELSISTTPLCLRQDAMFPSKHDTFGVSQYLRSLAALLERVHTKRFRDPTLEQYTDLKEQIWNALLTDIEILLSRSDIHRFKGPVMSAFETSLKACSVTRDTDRAMYILKILISRDDIPISNTIKTKCIDVCVWDRHGHVVSREILEMIDRHNKKVAAAAAAAAADDDDDNEGNEDLYHTTKTRVNWNDAEKELRLHFLDTKKQIDAKMWLRDLNMLEKRTGASHADVKRSLELGLKGFHSKKDWRGMFDIILEQSRRGLMLSHRTIAECMNLHLLSRHHVRDNEIWDHSVSAPFLEDIRDVVISNDMKFTRREHILALTISRLTGRADMARAHFDKIAPLMCGVNRQSLHDYILSLKDPYVTAEETEGRIEDAIKFWDREESVGIDASTFAHAIFALGTKFVHLPEASQEEEESKESKGYRILVKPSISYFERGIDMFRDTTTEEQNRLYHSKLCTNALQLCRKAKYEYEFASQVLNIMKERELPLKSPDINALMEISSARGDRDAVYNLFSEVLERKDLSPHPFQLDSIIRLESHSKPVDELEEMMLSYSEKYNIRPPMKCLEYIQDLAMKTEDSTYNHVATRIRAMRFERLVDLAGGIRYVRSSVGGGEEEDFL